MPKATFSAQEKHVAAKLRFSSRFSIDANTGCWNWTAMVSRKSLGYGRMWDGYRFVMAHRFSWELFVGEIPEKKSVLHKCDNSICVNPKHLYLGTLKENSHDSYIRSRKGIGRDKVEEVRRLHAEGMRGKEIALRLSLCQSTVSQIINGRVYKMIPVKGAR